jgi:hypothetical protein
MSQVQNESGSVDVVAGEDLAWLGNEVAQGAK